MKKKILIFPAGTEIAFEIVNALKYSKFVELYGGTSADDHSEFVYKNLIKGFPYVNDNRFLDYLNDVIKKYEIDCIYPAHDSVSVYLSDNCDKIQAQVIIADKDTTNICRSKKATYEYLKDYSFIPKTYENVDLVESYPVFVKPSVGQGSNGARKAASREELEEAIKQDDSLVICEYLPGMEYTVDCFTDNNGHLLVNKFRDRERIRNGIAVRSSQINTPIEISEIAQILNQKFNFIGAWFFQVKQDSNGKYKILEISPRIPGTMGLSRNTGINFPMLTLFTFWGFDVSVIDNGYGITLDRAFYSAYRIQLEYEHVYLDFDDTLIVNGKTNQDIMRFIYQAVNQGKKLHLLSKHSTDIFQDLKKHRIAENLFETIDVIAIDDEKYRYINEDKAIFIDDSFTERRKVHQTLGIAVFDVDMVESLIDWRV